MGVYVHFPWCLKKCPYCDFVSYAAPRESIDHAGYADAVIAELERRRPALGGRRLATVFFGGGTPSLWEAPELGRVLAAIRAAFHDGASPQTPAGSASGPANGGEPGGAGEARASGAMREEVEVTVECNPTSLDEERARALVGVGVNRLSVGVQGLDAGRLSFLGRLHGPEDGLEALRAALSAGVPRVSGNLIYGVAGGREEQAGEAAAEASRVAATGVTHVSAYSLTIEPGTQFGELARRGRLPLATDDAVADSFFAIEEALTAQGFEHYEISNYARPGQEARHNLGYWRGRDYLGLGCAAFGTLSDGTGARRYRNLVDPQRYTKAALGGGDLVESEEALDPEARLRERIMLGLRLAAGLDLDEAVADLGVPAWSASAVGRPTGCTPQGASRSPATALVPARARVFTDGIAAALF